jgi:hypothetical protein
MNSTIQQKKVCSHVKLRVINVAGKVVKVREPHTQEILQQLILQQEQQQQQQQTLNIIIFATFHRDVK